MTNHIDTATRPASSLPEPQAPEATGNASGPSADAASASNPASASRTFLPAALQNLPPRAVASNRAAQVTSISTLSDDNVVEILKHLDGPSLDTTLGVSRRFKDLVIQTRQKQVAELAQRPGRITQTPLPTRIELFDMGIPKPDFHNILNTLDTASMGSVMRSAPLAKNMRMHAHLQTTAQRLGIPLEVRMTAVTSEVGQINASRNTHGFGIRTFYDVPGTEYAGAFDNDVFRGLGYIVHGSGARYEGMWENGKMHGYGRLRCLNGDYYEGAWKNNQRHGHGVLASQDGQRYTGMWENDKKHGYGVAIHLGGNRYEGSWVNDKPYGQCTMHFSDGRCYEGIMEYDERQGRGTLSWPDGVRFEGTWKNGKPYGPGTLISPDGIRRTDAWAAD